ncbi:MAG: hypothetical protein AAF160_05540 [Pseudomonadota bacterium]
MRSAATCRAAAAALSVAMIGLAAPAGASVIGFDLTIDGSLGTQPGSLNVPIITLTNRSDTAQLENFSLTIGDPAFNFDGVVELVGPAGGTVSLTEGDTNISRVDGVNTDRISFDFTGFDPGESISFGVDVDADSGVFQQDFREVLFNNGSAENAIASAGFGSGMPLVLTLADVTDPGEIYEASARSAHGGGDELIPTPIPASLLLLGGSLAGVGFMVRRRRNA